MENSHFWGGILEIHGMGSGVIKMVVVLISLNKNINFEIEDGKKKQNIILIKGFGKCKY